MTSPNRKSMTYELFRDGYKPFIRPDHHIKNIKRAFSLDAQFEIDFRYLRSAINNGELEWAESIILFMCQQDALDESFQINDLATLRSLYRTHHQTFRKGAFDEDYLDSLEDLALFFIYHDIKSLWLAGAYRQMTERLIDQLFDRVVRNKKVPVKKTCQILLRTMAMELNQIQRCFTLYERHVSQSLIQDLTYGGFLSNKTASKNHTSDAA